MFVVEVGHFHCNQLREQLPGRSQLREIEAVGCFTNRERKREFLRLAHTYRLGRGI